MKYELENTRHFEQWMKKLTDKTIKNKVLARLARVENGNFGDFKKISNRLFELRFFFGGGLRIYYTTRGNKIVLLLNGGDKASQSKDIKKAKQILDEME